MPGTKNVGRAHVDDAFMRLMQPGVSPRPAKLYEAYQAGGWPSVHERLVEMLRIAERQKNAQDADQVARALTDVFKYRAEDYGLGQCSYISADVPLGTRSAEIKEYERRGIFLSREATVLDPRTARHSSHYFLSPSAKRVPRWCPDHSGAARGRTHRQKDLKDKRAGKYI